VEIKGPYISHYYSSNLFSKTSHIPLFQHHIFKNSVSIARNPDEMGEFLTEKNFNFFTPRR
jgi:hypothetical protein